jgi:hypothetical protein
MSHFHRTDPFTGRIEFEIDGLAAGIEHDVLNISGCASLGGTLAITVVPEPSTAPMTLLFGSALLLFRRRPRE